MTDCVPSANPHVAVQLTSTDLEPFVTMDEAARPSVRTKRDRTARQGIKEASSLDVDTADRFVWHFPLSR